MTPLQQATYNPGEFKLRNFQEEDLPYFLAHPFAGIWYEPRLGKTVLTCFLMALGGHRRIHISCPTNAFATWMLHIPRVFAQLRPELKVKVMYVRDQQPVRMHKYTAKYQADVVVWITTFNSFLYDWKELHEKKWHETVDMWVLDEYHKFLKNRKTKAFEMYDKMTRPAKRVHGLTGTPTTKGMPAEFWPMLHIFDRKYFSSYWKYVYAFHHVEDNGFGKSLIMPRNEIQFQHTLKMFGRVRTRAEDAPNMPKVTRQLLPVELTKDQKQMLDELKQFDMLATGDGRLVVAQTGFEDILRQRQILACPKILDPTKDVGGAMLHLLDEMRYWRDENPDENHLTIFTPFRKALEYYKEALHNENFYNVVLLHGGMDPRDLTAGLEKLVKTKGIAICTIAFAQAFSLASINKCYFIGYEWTPDANKQAEDRHVPQEGTHPINAWYYSYPGTIDDAVADRVTIRQENINITMGFQHHPKPAN